MVARPTKVMESDHILDNIFKVPMSIRFSF